jgi:hypothetical protein
VTAAGAACANREVVANQLAAAVGENRGRLLKQSRYYWLLLAESHLTRRLFGGTLQRIVTLPVPAG